MRRSSSDDSGRTQPPTEESGIEDDPVTGHGSASGEGSSSADGPIQIEEFGLVETVRLVLATALFVVVDRLSALYGRDRSLWVFGARNGTAFADNAKYLYLHAVAERPDVRPVWVSRDAETVRELQAEGYEAYHVHSPWGIYYTLRAGVVCLTQDFRDVNLACAGGADVGQLWHGIPIKRIGWDAEIPHYPPAIRRCLGYLLRRAAPVVVTAEALADTFASGLGVDRLVVGGYPRLDAIDRPIDGEGVGVDDGVAAQLDRAAQAGPLLLYLPTYREVGEGFEDHLDLDALEAFLAARDAHLAVKPHPKESVDLGARSGSRVIAVPPGTDVYPLARRADVLVTDYSSILFDWLPTDRPLVFYPYDLDSYREKRGFYVDYETVTPGPTATDFEELLGAMGEVLDGDEYAEERATVRGRFFDHPDADQSALTFRALESAFEDGYCY